MVSLRVRMPPRRSFKVFNFQRWQEDVLFFWRRDEAATLARVNYPHSKDNPHEDESSYDTWEGVKSEDNAVYCYHMPRLGLDKGARANRPFLARSLEKDE